MRSARLTTALLVAFFTAPCAFATAAGSDVSMPPPPPPAVRFSSATTSEVLISRVYANAARDNEFVEIANGGDDPSDLSGWSLTDGETTSRFPAGVSIPAGGRLVVTQNSTSYEEDLLEPASFTWDRGAGPRMEGGGLRLANDGDEVILRDVATVTMDVYAYGDSSYNGPGWEGGAARAMGRGEVALRRVHDHAFEDRDSAVDWEDVRDHRIGQSRLHPSAIDLTGPVRAFVSPDDGRNPILSFLGSAESTIDVSGYTMTSEAIGSLLAAGAMRGVRVRILLDGSPVGGLDADAVRIAGILASAGADVRWLRGAEDIIKRYRYLHAKYVIVDDRRVFVSSENFGDAGFPGTGETGNRGWTLTIEDLALARQLRDVFEEDFDPRHRDLVPAGLAVTELPFRGWTPEPWTPGAPSVPRLARLVIAPDNALDPLGLIETLSSARARIWIQAFYIEETWRDVPNPYVEAAFEAARRGVEVRILMDGSWWNDDPDADGNDDVVKSLNARAAIAGANLQARLIAPYGMVERVHNKGVLVDGSKVFVSSMNWAHASVTENREIGILLEDVAVASRFEAALRADWSEASQSEDGFRLADPLALAVLYALVATASLVSLRKLRRGPKSLKPRHKMGRRVLSRGVLRRRGREVRVLPVDVVAESERRGRRRGHSTRGRRETP